MSRTALAQVTKNRKLTIQQEQFLSVLADTNFDFEEARRIAGYKSSAKEIAARLKDEINELIDTMLIMEAAKSVEVLKTIRDSDKNIINAATKANIAMSFLDRSGHGRKETVQVDHEIKHGIFILPTKDEVVINQEVENSDG